MYRIGKVSYLNTLPLFYRWSDAEMELVEGHPSYLVELLRKGEIQAGIVSSVEYLLNPQDYVYVPKVSISSREKVCSVLLFSKKPAHAIKTLYLTPASLTSKHLCVYVLEEIYRAEPQTTPDPNHADALLLIGDDALRLNRLNKYPYVYDLAYEWYRVHGLPFVFALFLVRKEYSPVLLEKIEKLCRVSVDVFFEDLKDGKISSEGYTREELREYFTECLSNDLGEQELLSLEIFREFLERKGYIQIVEDRR